MIARPAEIIPNSKLGMLVNAEQPERLRLADDSKREGELRGSREAGSRGVPDCKATREQKHLLSTYA